MSAFICSDDHFKALAIFAATRTPAGWTVDPRYNAAPWDFQRAA